MNLTNHKLSALNKLNAINIKNMKPWLLIKESKQSRYGFARNNETSSVNPTGIKQKTSTNRGNTGTASVISPNANRRNSNASTTSSDNTRAIYKAINAKTIKNMEANLPMTRAPQSRYGFAQNNSTTSSSTSSGSTRAVPVNSTVKKNNSRTSSGNTRTVPVNPTVKNNKNSNASSLGKLRKNAPAFIPRGQRP